MNKKRAISHKRKTLIRICIQEEIKSTKSDNKKIKEVYDYLTEPRRCPDLFITMTLKDAPLYAFQNLTNNVYKNLIIRIAQRILKERSYKNASKNLLFKTN